MGQYTKFEVSIIRKEQEVDDSRVVACVTELAGIVNRETCTPEYEPPYNQDTCFTVNVKWYDHQSDLEDLTAKYRGIVIQADCEDENGEMWRERYLNGDCEIHDAQICYPKFDIE